MYKYLCKCVEIKGNENTFKCKVHWAANGKRKTDARSATDETKGVSRPVDNSFSS